MEEHTVVMNHLIEDSISPKDLSIIYRDLSGLWCLKDDLLWKFQILARSWQVGTLPVDVTMMLLVGFMLNGHYPGCKPTLN